VALIGDASGSVDAVTGEGISIAIKQAHALAAAVERDDLAHYQRAHRSLMRRPQIMASLLLLLDRNAQLQRLALAGLMQAPPVFRYLLGMHVGAKPLTAILRSFCRLERQKAG
jgi:flavin-dependent dehydrogenase